MKKIPLLAAALSLTILAGCGKPGGTLLPTGSAVSASQLSQAQLEVDVQLGLLKDHITQAERQAALELWLMIQPIQEQRIANGKYERSDYEWRLLRRLSKLYDQYTIQYLGGDEEGFGFQHPPERQVGSYIIEPGGTLRPGEGHDLTGSNWTEGELLALWDQMGALLPQGAFDDFAQFTLFTDGPGEVVAYVYPLDGAGTSWEIAVDPADAGDWEYFVETILHEYFHYLSLNSTQVIYTSQQTLDTYNEDHLVSRPGSYLDDFYQEFWPGYLGDCLALEDTYLFFLRHYDDFITPYASTGPSEDLCESFAFFVLRPRDPRAEEDVWSQKLDFFYQYAELTDLREAVRDNLDLDPEEYFETWFAEESQAAA